MVVTVIPEFPRIKPWSLLFGSSSLSYQESARLIIGTKISAYGRDLRLVP